MIDRMDDLPEPERPISSSFFRELPAMMKRLWGKTVSSAEADIGNMGK